MFSPLAGKAVDAMGPAPIIRMALGFVAAGVLMYALLPINFYTFIGAGMVIGVGIAALLGTPLRYIIIEESRPEDRASAQGLLNIFLAIGQLSGAAVVGAVATSSGGGVVGYQAAFLVLSVLSLAIIPVAFGLKKRVQQAEEPAT